MKAIDKSESLQPKNLHQEMEGEKLRRARVRHNEYGRHKEVEEKKIWEQKRAEREAQVKAVHGPQIREMKRLMALRLRLERLRRFEEERRKACEEVEED